MDQNVGGASPGALELAPKSNSETRWAKCSRILERELTRNCLKLGPDYPFLFPARNYQEVAEPAPNTKLSPHLSCAEEVSLTENRVLAMERCHGQRDGGDRGTGAGRCHQGS